MTVLNLPTGADTGASVPMIMAVYEHDEVWCATVPSGRREPPRLL